MNSRRLLFISFILILAIMCQGYPQRRAITASTSASTNMENALSWEHRGLLITDDGQTGTEIYFPVTLNRLLNELPNQLAYTSWENFNTDIYLVNADGSGREPLLTGPDNEQDPSWSPDGQKLAFSADYTGTFLIYILDMNTRQITGFAPSITNLRLPHWSPDGSRIAYVASYGDYEELWVEPIDSSDPPLRVLTIDNRPQICGIQDYTWSPDGSQIAVEAYWDEGEGVGTWCAPIVINRDGTNLRLLGNWEDTSNLMGCGNNSHSPTWSPDSQWIAFSQKDPSFVYWQFNPFKTTQDGAILERIAHIDPSDHTDYLDYLAWSPDGKSLVFSVDPGTGEVNNSLQLIDLSTKEITHLVDNDDLNWNPAWSPDGKLIAYRHILWDDSEINVIDLAQGSIINVTSSSARNDRFAWRPNNSVSPPPANPVGVCALAGITQPSISTDFRNGLADFGAIPAYTDTYLNGQVVFTDPGVHLYSDESSKAYLAFRSWEGGDTLAVRLITANIYQLGLLVNQAVLSDGTWANAAQNGNWMVGLHTDHIGSPNGNILYSDLSGTLNTFDQFNLPAAEEIVVVFHLPQRQFKVYDRFGTLLLDRPLPPQWFGGESSDWRWWLIGDAWSDSLHKVDFQLLELCYAESP